MFAMLHIHTRHLEYQAEAQSESSAMNLHIFDQLQGESLSYQSPDCSFYLDKSIDIFAAFAVKFCHQPSVILIRCMMLTYPPATPNHRPPLFDFLYTTLFSIHYTLQG